jgi:hypothetical protein
MMIGNLLPRLELLMLRKVVLVSLALARGAAAQGTNQAQFFTGSFDWMTTLELRGQPSDGNVSKAVESVSVGITGGKALCKGTYNETVDTYQAGKLISRATTVGTISGPGYALIEFGVGTETHTGKPIYTITVSCPTHSGTVTSESFVPGGSGSTDQIKAEPAAQGHHEWSTYAQLDTGNGQTLMGSTDDQHPDADPPNNVVGRVKLMWSLTRIARP